MILNIEKLLLEADKMIEQDEYDNAMLYLKTVLEIDENNVVALTSIIEIYSKFEMYKQALEFAEKFYKKYPKNKDAIFSLGYIYQAMRKFKKAISIYKKFLEFEKNYFIYLNIATCYSFLKYFNKAMQYVQKAIDMDSKEIEAYIQRGDILAMMGEYEKSILEYKKLEKFENVNLAKLYARIGDTMFYAGNIEKMIENYNIAISCVGVQDSIFEDFFEMLLQVKEYKQIELLFLNYENTNLDRIKMLNLKGRYFLATKKYKKAEKVCRQMILLEPNNARHYYNLIFILSKENKHDEAFKLINDNQNILTYENIVNELIRKLKSGKRRYDKKLREKNLIEKKINKKDLKKKVN